VKLQSYWDEQHLFGDFGDNSFLIRWFSAAWLEVKRINRRQAEMYV
jgi:hypothetical protein